MPVLLPPAPLCFSKTGSLGCEHPMLAEVLWRRGFRSSGEVQAFLDPASAPPFNPFDIPGVDHAVSIIQTALEGNRNLWVYGDYDADGVTATALLVKALGSMGGKVDSFIPERTTEGYGLNREALEELARRGAEVVVTCDCGVGNMEEVEFARELGLTMVISDHHQLSEKLPRAHALVTSRLLPPAHPARDLAGVGVAYALVLALLKVMGKESEAETFLDLVALGTIGDSVPLLGENRRLVRDGLRLINQGQHPGIQSLKMTAGIGLVSSEDVAFQLVPRLNAAGRMASAKMALRLLLARDRQEALPLARELDRLNLERRRLTGEMMREAMQEVAAAGDQPAITCYRPDWSLGLLGLVAGRLAEATGKPALVMADDPGGQVVGSARAGSGVSVYEVLNRCRPWLLRFGGHVAAAGFTLNRKDLGIFIEKTSLAAAGLLPVISRGNGPDALLELAEANEELLGVLELLEPFGEGNPAPRFFIPEVTVAGEKPLGKGHLRLVLETKNCRKDAIWWRAEISSVSQGPLDVFASLRRRRMGSGVELEILAMQPATVPGFFEGSWVEVLDRRGEAGDGSLVEEFSGAGFFAEGELRVDHATFDRLTFSPCETLVLLTPPPDPGVLARLVAHTGARRLVLATPGGMHGANQVKDFLSRLRNFVMDKGFGSDDKALVAACLGESEASVEAAFCLQDAPSGRFSVSASMGEPVLQRCLEESMAFRRFLSRAAPEEIAATLASSGFLLTLP